MRDWIELGDLKTCAIVANTMRFRQNLEPLLMDAPKADRITVIAPHPDDEMLGPGGVLLHAIKSATPVHVIYLTSGKFPEEIENETKSIGNKVGYTCQFLRLPLGAIPNDEKTVSLLAKALESSNPRALFLPFLFDDHDEHRRANELLLKAHDRGLLSKKIEIWGYQVYTALPGNVVIDITDVSSAKADVIRGWESQMRTRDWAHYMLGLNAFNCRFLKSRKVAYAECFFVLPLQDYIDLCRIYFVDPSKTYYSAGYTSAN